MTDYGIAMANGTMYQGEYILANFSIKSATPHYAPESLQSLEALGLELDHLGQQHSVTYNLHASTSLVDQIISQVPTCRFFNKCAAANLEAYTIELSQQSQRIGLFFRHTGNYTLYNGNCVYVCGSEIIGDCGDHLVAVAPEIASIRLVHDPDMDERSAVSGTVGIMMRHPEISLPAVGYVPLSYSRSLVMKERPSTIFPALNVVGQQNFGKTFLVTNYCLLCDDDRTAKTLGHIASNSTDKGVMQQVTKYFDLMILADDLAKSSDPSEQKRRMQLFASTLRFVANDDERVTASSIAEYQSMRCMVGCAFTGELPFVTPSDITRTIHLELTHPIRDGSPKDRIMVATAMHGFLSWFVQHRLECINALKAYTDRASREIDARLCTSYNLLTWSTDCFFSYAKEIGVLSDTEYDKAMRTAVNSYQKLLKRQQIMANNSMPQGNLAWHILECYHGKAFLRVDKTKELLKNKDACLVENGMLLVRLKTLTERLNQCMPGARFTANALGRQLRAQGIIVTKAERRTETKRVRGTRFLSIDLAELKKLAVRF